MLTPDMIKTLRRKAKKYIKSGDFDKLKNDIKEDVVLAVLVDATIATIIQKLPLVHPARAAQAALLAACVVGARSASQRVHAGLLLFLTLFILLVMLTRPFWLGSFAA